MLVSSHAVVAYAVTFSPSNEPVEMWKEGHSGLVIESTRVTKEKGIPLICS